jgi:hypothetical protein
LLDKDCREFRRVAGPVLEQELIWGHRHDL